MKIKNKEEIILSESLWYVKNQPDVYEMKINSNGKEQLYSKETEEFLTPITESLRPDLYEVRHGKLISKKTKLPVRFYYEDYLDKEMRFNELLKNVVPEDKYNNKIDGIDLKIIIPSNSSGESDCENISIKRSMSRNREYTTKLNHYYNSDRDFYDSRPAIEINGIKITAYRAVAALLFRPFKEFIYVQHVKLSDDYTNYKDEIYLREFYKYTYWESPAGNARKEVKSVRKKLFKYKLDDSIPPKTTKEWDNYFHIKGYLGRNRKLFDYVMDDFTKRNMIYYEKTYSDIFKKVFNEFKPIPGNSRHLINGFGFLKNKSVGEIFYPERCVTMYNRQFSVYQVVYNIFGKFALDSTQVIDHLNRNREDNCFLNLQQKSQKANFYNKKNNRRVIYFKLDLNSLSYSECSLDLCNLAGSSKRTNDIVSLSISRNSDYAIFTKYSLINYLTNSKSYGNIYVKLDSRFKLVDTCTNCCDNWGIYNNKLNTNTLIDGNFYYYTLDYYWRKFPERLKDVLLDDYDEVYNKMKELNLIIKEGG